MRRTAIPLAGLVAAALLAGCEAAPGPAADARAPGGDAGAATPEAAPTDDATGEAPASDPAGPAAEASRRAVDVPHIYMALQPGGPGHPDSVVFAIDAARDRTPSDDPAIRLTPDGGRCNPQEMRRYDFPAGTTTPVVSEAEAERGLTARDLPRFLAAAVTGRLIEAGLASEPEDTRPLNVCTRKLWERLVAAESRASG